MHILHPPPLHPILVNFTAALVPVSLACDLLARVTGRDSLRAAGWWTICFAAVVTPFTALAGWFWLWSMGGIDATEMLVHQWLGTSLAVLLIPLAWWRWRIHMRSEQTSAKYLLVTGVFVLALVVQGHLGGRMSFGQMEDAHERGEKAAEHSHATTQPEWHDHIEVKD